MSRIEKIKTLINEKVLIGDGAMGTMIYSSGVFLNRCFEELNLSDKNLISRIHDEYISVGVDFIETNTFGANEIKLGKYGLADKLELINSEGVRLAKEAAGNDVLVAGSIGPSGYDTASWVGEVEEVLERSFRSHIQVLNDTGVDFVLFETFGDTRELEIALKVADGFDDLPVVAQICINENQTTQLGGDIIKALKKLTSFNNVVAVGFNCGVGPSHMLEAVEQVSASVDKPLSVMPNAGMPREVDGRSIYMSTPEYMAEYAKRFFEKNVRIIGGCCGTTPDHIREMVKSIRSMDRASFSSEVRVIERFRAAEEIKGVEPMPLSERSEIGRKLAAGEEILSIEILPPRGIDLSSVIEKSKICAEQGIDAINIPDGPRASSRLSPMITGLNIIENVDVEVILHVCCRDRNLISMQSDMLGAHVLGLKNVLLITGDPPKLGEFPDATAVFDLDSIALTSVVKNLNCGIDIAGKKMDQPLSMTISVGANPVASDFEREVERFKRKVDAGAEYCITQPVFDIESLYRFMDAVGSHRIPVMAGIWPFASYKNAEFMANEVPGVVVPGKLLERISKAKTREDGRKIGVDIAREMVEAVRKDVAGFTVSAPFGNVNTALAVLGKGPVE